MAFIDENKIKINKKKGIPAMQFGVKQKTGSWRVYKPVIDKKKCIKCKTCWLVCPEGAITMGKDGKPKIDYDICKGCLTCVAHCPVKAITAKKET